VSAIAACACLRAIAAALRSASPRRFGRAASSAARFFASFSALRAASFFLTGGQPHAGVYVFLAGHDADRIALEVVAPGTGEAVAQ
jgi:hypothetical protein